MENNILMTDIIPILFDYLDLRSKYKLALLDCNYSKQLHLYKKSKLYTNSNIKQLQLIIKKWKAIKNERHVNNSWSPKRKLFDREILLF